MHIITRLLGDGPRWCSSRGLFGMIVEFSEWPEGEELEDTKEWLALIIGALERHATAHKTTAESEKPAPPAPTSV